MEASDQTQDPQGAGEYDESVDPAAREEGQDPEETVEGSQGEQVASDAPNEIGQSTPVATSAPDPAAQSGVPLPEDREAGVEPGPVHPGDESSDEERPEGADPTSPSAASPNE